VSKPNVQRWECETNEFGDSDMQKNIIGNYVRYEDYARLKTEVERLEMDVWRMKVFKGIDEDTKATLKDALNTVPEWAKVLEVEAENARLKAEVERLTLENDIRQNNMNEMFKEIKEGREAYHRLHNRYMIIVTAKGVQS
jgi:MarR-like DNA-binding transcriptional regulator SgrR of sgrS sRNA